MNVNHPYTQDVKKTIYSPEHSTYLTLLRQIRHNAAMTQLEVAEKLNVPQSRISDYERGERQMDLLELRQYCDALGVSIVDFVRRVDEAIRLSS